jgi:hypothetical protein
MVARDFSPWTVFQLYYSPPGRAGERLAAERQNPGRQARGRYAYAHRSASML